MVRQERCNEYENTIALRGIYWRPSYLVETPDFAPSPHDEFAFAAWLIGPQCEAWIRLFGGHGQMYYATMPPLDTLRRFHGVTAAAHSLYQSRSGVGGLLRRRDREHPEARGGYLAEAEDHVGTP
jgi:hypothetical protein